MPQFVLGGTPDLAHGDGVELLPGQGTQVCSDYDKYWYDHSGPSKYYKLSDLVAEPNSENIAPRPSQTPTLLEFTDSPRTSRQASVSTSLHTDVGQDVKRDIDPRFLGFPPSGELALNPQDLLTSSVAQYSKLSLPNYSPSFSSLNSRDPTTPFTPIHANSFPLYSTSGFDMLRMLGKIATRPNPKVVLGPVDLTCSFVVVDVRTVDSPIVYASPTFTRLTGYPESEILGRNCRFLQAPSGQVQRGVERRFTAPDAVRHLQKCLVQDKECQASLVNYRKDGGAFINLVTVIPVAAEDGSDEITHHVGFQVDLVKQPNAILQKLRDGSYIVNYSSMTSLTSYRMLHKDRRERGVSQEMIALLRAWKPLAMDDGPTEKSVRDQERAELHAMLLANTDDFIHVVSLKGALLYVAPSIQRTLAYNPAELIKKSIAYICHPADVVPILRELKEATSMARPPSSSGHNDSIAHNPFQLPQPPQSLPHKPVNLLYRARHKNGKYVWLEARGRLHVEKGKGRKAVVLVGRRVNVPSLRWGAVSVDESDAACWGLVAPNGLILSASSLGAERLGYGASNVMLVGRSIASLVKQEESRRVSEVLAGAACADKGEVRRVQCEMLMKLEGDFPGVRTTSTEIAFFAHEKNADAESETSRSPPFPSGLIFRIHFFDSPTEASVPAFPSETPKSALQPPPAWSSSLPCPKRICAPSARPADTNVLEELDMSRETNWQYEFARLQFENQRMRDEVDNLERTYLAQLHMPSYMMQKMEMYSGSGSLPAMLPSIGAPSQLQLHAAHPQKRTRDGELKLLSPI